MAITLATVNKWVHERWCAITREKSDELNLYPCGRCRGTGYICKEHIWDASDDCMCDDPIPCPGEPAPYRELGCVSS